MPPTNAHELDMVLPVESSSVPEARRAIEQMARDAGACSGSVEALRLAVSEACTNVVLHAYRDRDPGRLHLRASVDGRRLRVAVCDHGIGITPLTDSPGLGLGLPLIASLTEELQLQSEGNANRLAMCFALDTPPPAFAAT